jgi:hypothetical protein
LARALIIGERPLGWAWRHATSRNDSTSTGAG